MHSELTRNLQRRTFLHRAGVGVGAAALSSLIDTDSAYAGSGPALNAGQAGYPNLPARVKRVIFLCMAGGPSHLETFDY
ncbi:MAG: twin-arginine translocation signal domain-containing protein, partial [Fuerstiella sp.]